MNEVYKRLLLFFPEHTLAVPWGHSIALCPNHHPLRASREASPASKNW